MRSLALEVLKTTISGESMHIEKGIARIDTTISLRAEVFEYLDKCFRLIDLTWNDFFQKEIEDIIESLGEGGSDWLGEMIQSKLKEI